MIIADIIPQDDFFLQVVTEDKRTGLFDVKPYMHSEVFAQLREGDNFQKIHNGKYFVEWECGADLSADTIHANIDFVSHTSC